MRGASPVYCSFMANQLTDSIRTAFPVVLKEKMQSDKPDHFDLSDIAARIGAKLGRRVDVSLEQAVLDVYFELFRSGLISFCYSTSRGDLMKFRLTDAGNSYLEDAEHAPENLVGYLAGIPLPSGLSAVGQSYLDEALRVFGSGHYRAAAVLLGAAAESTVLEIRDAYVKKLEETRESPRSTLTDQNASAKQIYEALDKTLTERKDEMPTDLAEEFDAHWYSFLSDIRLSRNESGHPRTIAPVTRDAVRAGFLQLRSIARVAADLKSWIESGFAAK